MVHEEEDLPGANLSAQHPHPAKRANTRIICFHIFKYSTSVAQPATQANAFLHIRPLIKALQPEAPPRRSWLLCVGLLTLV
jgi:hypothetical protein